MLARFFEHRTGVTPLEFIARFDPSLIFTIVAVLLVGLVLTPAAALVNLPFAWRQWREGRGTWLRLLSVCAVIGVLQIAPLLVLARVYDALGDSTHDQVLPAAVLIVWNWLLLILALGRPVRLAHSREQLPLVEDEQFNSRVAELAAAMGLRTPVVRMVRSLSGEQMAAAFAGGLPAPSLVVTDGILNRLSPDERDGVVAHELAHLANGSLWWLTCVTPAAAIAGLLAAGAAGGWFGVLFALALRVGLLRIVSRWFERDCDRRAADVIGYRTTASALGKIHAAHVLRDAGWRSVLVYATATHPSRVERLAALERTAPAHDLPGGDLADAARPRIFAARVAAALWCVVLFASLAGQTARPGSVWPNLLLVGVLTVPFWPLIDAWRKLTRLRKRTRRSGWRRPIGLALMAAVGLFYLLGDRVTVPSPAFLALQLLMTVSGLLGLLLFAGGGSLGSSRVRQRLLKALHEHDFETAARIGDDHLRAVRRDPELCHNVAVARVLSGDRENGLDELRANVGRHPRFAQSLLTLSSFHFDAGDDALALDTALRAAGLLKRDPAPLIQQAAALWRLGRLDEAETIARDAMERDPDSGEPHAVLAGILLSRGDAPGARDAIQTAERLSPGLPFARVVEAEVELRSGGPEQARQAVERAREAARANPFAVIDRQVERLESQLPLIAAEPM